MHQNRNGVQDFDGFGEGLRLGRTVAVAVGRAVVGAAVAVGADAEAEALGRALADFDGFAETCRVGAAEVVAGATVGVSLAAGTVSSTGALIGRAAPLPSGATRASTPAPPRTRPAAVRMAARRRFGAAVRRERRRCGSPSRAGRAVLRAGSTAVASTGAGPPAAPQPGQDSAPLRWRRHGAQ
ncbi:hypothetical protein [Kitasatospora sp. NPDC093679]|uniref:hypothetical protein n=1 Tax=Kitasatospora sp. NPDC093679 TaxID=3154983 RepID=UPI00341D2EDD